MKKQRLFLFLFFLFLFGKSSAQSYLLTPPRLVVYGNQLIIYYDLLAKNSNDKFYIWVEMEKTNGEKISAKAFSGDVGDNLKAGYNKKIIWTAEKDSIYLNEKLFVEVKAEKYNKSFNKGSMMLLSTVFPGWGQTKINKNKLWCLTGIAAYGTLAGSYLFHKSYLKSYASYKIEEDPIKRTDLLEQTQKQLNISTVVLYSAASAWALNILRVACTPNSYQPLKNVKFSLNSSPNPSNGGLLLSFRFDF